MLSRAPEREALLADLQQVVTKRYAEGIDPAPLFPSLFQRFMSLLELTDDAASRMLCTSQPTIRRWNKGTVIPPAAGIVLHFMLEELELITAEELEPKNAETRQE